MNILFAFADDWGRYASAYAQYENEKSLNKLISTPNFDRVAAEGILFRNAFVPAPSCTPCRSAVLSGQYFWQTGLGAILFGAVWDENIPTYPLELEKQGYFIGHTYKVWAPGRVMDAPYGGERTAYDKAGRDFGDFSFYVTKRAPEIGIEAAKEELYAEVRENFDSFLEARPKEKPFCYWWGPTNTHRLWQQGSGKNLWGIEPDNLKGRMPKFLPDVHEIREDFADYLGECMAFDAGVGVLLKRLEEIGELDNTLVVVSGDHGIPGMPRGKCNLYNIGCEVALAMRLPGTIQSGRVVDDMINIMDLAPTFLEIAGKEIPETMTAKSMKPLLVSEKNGQIDPSRDFVVTGKERHVTDLPYPMRSIRTKDYLYIINFEPDRWPMGDPCGVADPQADMNTLYPDIAFNTFAGPFIDMDASPTKAWIIDHRNEENVKFPYQLAFGKRLYEELYDLKKDSDYINNVAGEEEYATVRDELNKKLMNLLIEQNDPRVVENPCRYEDLPYAVLK